MPRPTPGQVHRLRAGIVLGVAALAIVGAAAAGWWYARESPPHQGPIVLIALDGLPIAGFATYGGPGDRTSAIDRLARDAVVFERAYTHSLQMLPAHVSILSGQLPVEHGVRDDVGFRVPPGLRTLAEQLRSRGFATGAAVSSFLLRRESGLSKGFGHFDSERPKPSGASSTALERAAADTIDAADTWMQAQRGRRFFLFVQVGGDAPDRAVGRIVERLQARGDYDAATIVLVGDRGDVGPGVALTEASLSVPLLVKQPGQSGAGRRVSSPVQHIDLVPTILDLVRAPIPSSLRGRSLRRVLDGSDDVVHPEQPIYSESLAARFRFGGQPVFALTETTHRYVRGVEESVVPVGDVAAESEADAGRLRSELERLVTPAPVPKPRRIAAADEDDYALAGLLGSVSDPQAPAPTMTDEQQATLVVAHRDAATLVGRRNYLAGVQALRTMARAHPMVAALRYQLGVVLARVGRLDEAATAFRVSLDIQPHSVDSLHALTEALLRAGHVDAAFEQATALVALAERGEDTTAVAAAHEMAARVDVARQDSDGAAAHAAAAETANPSRPVRAFIRGRQLVDEGAYADAVTELQQAIAALERGDDAGGVLGLHLLLGDALVKLERPDDAEMQYRAEITAFPRNLEAYVGLAMLHHASSRETDVQAVVDELLASAPTPVGYATAARVWSAIGDRGRANALRSEARVRFRGDPSLALLASARR